MNDRACLAGVNREPSGPSGLTEVCTAVESAVSGTVWRSHHRACL
ncbi:hypothetical protein KNU62_gp43 [Gordonia phage Bakery]|uniref:Uncharacterized protein n=1 Tax=Gordonia phage Bakery TaxID=2591205 RepID=A0A514DGT7_9CAUD|nr:hypothetical protein KNU62_gp43 [Gordonia phage Bakery]QDH92828.1 hypothetical protein SEA_BAKERY_43 [Gordonia phage Bakery]